MCSAKLTNRLASISALGHLWTAPDWHGLLDVAAGLVGCGHPLTELDNVVLTPHSAYNTPEAATAMLDMAIGNLEAFYAGNPMNVVTRSAG